MRSTPGSTLDRYRIPTRLGVEAPEADLGTEEVRAPVALASPGRPCPIDGHPAYRIDCQLGGAGGVILAVGLLIVLADYAEDFAVAILPGDHSPLYFALGLSMAD
jgi:hypothetical protein